MGKRSLRIAGGDILVCVNLVGLDVVPEDVGWNVRRNVAQALVIKPSGAAFARILPGEGAGPMGGREAHVNFDAPAVLRKWPSLRNERRTEGTGPYLLVNGTLDECLRELMAKPASMRHLYEIHTSPQPPLVSSVLSGEHVVELARLRYSL